MTEHTEPKRFQCRHIFTDGRRCGSPSLRNEHFCYYHGKTRRTGTRQPQVKTLTDRKNSTFELPSPADLAERSGIQLAIGLILHKIAHNEIDPRRAGLLLYGLQIASSNLPSEKAPTKVQEPAEFVEELVHDAEIGPLAPEADWEENRPKGTIQRLLEELECGDGYKPEQADDIYPISLSAAAANPRIPHCAASLHPRIAFLGPRPQLRDLGKEPQGRHVSSNTRHRAQGPNRSAITRGI